MKDTATAMLTPYMWFLMSRGVEFTVLPEIGEVHIGPSWEDWSDIENPPARIYLKRLDNGDYELTGTRVSPGHLNAGAIKAQWEACRQNMLLENAG